MRIAIHPQRACFVQWSALATLGAGLLATSPAAARGAIQYSYDATNQTVELSIEAVFRAPPTTDDMTLIKQEFLDAARIFCDATDGFVRLKQVNLTSGDGAQENGDFWLLPGYSRSNAGDHINLYRDAWNSLVIAHELGHYALGVDDSYPENRRGGGCGIGPSFDADVRLDEVWNSLFQQAGGWWCQDAAGRGLPELDPNWWWQAGCRTDADCPHVDDGTGTLVPGVHDPVTGDVIPMSCPASPVRYTELSVVANHDLRRGDGQVACPAPREGRFLVVGATLNPNDAVTAFDPSSFDAAAASVGPYAWAEYEVLDTLGRVEGLLVEYRGQSSHKLGLYFEHAGADQWNLHVLGRGEEYVGGIAGAPHLLDTLALGFVGATLTTVNGAPVGAPISIELGGADTGAFVPGADGSVAAPVALAVDLTGLVQEATRQWWEKAPAVGTALTHLDWANTGVFHGAAREPQVGICTNLDLCQRGFNSATGKFEAASQTLSYSLSDWDRMRQFVAEQLVLDVNLLPPAPLEPNPLPRPDVDCGLDPANPMSFIVENVAAAEQMLMVLDRSGSMELEANIGWAPAQTRLEYVQAAASVMVDVNNLKGTQVGLLSFNDEVQDIQELAIIDSTLPPPLPAGTVNPEDFKASIDALTPQSFTAIGTALHAAADKLAAAPAASKAVLLLTDGENNRGVEDPVTEAEALRAAGVAVYTVPVGNAADRILSANIAATSDGWAGGRMFDAPGSDELPSIFLEAFARSRSEALALGREPVDTWYTPCPWEFGCTAGGYPADWEMVDTYWGCQCLPPGETSPAYSPERALTIPVEAGAEQLNLLLSSRNPTDRIWSPRFELSDPAGTVQVDEESPSVGWHPLYRLIQLTAPAPGPWSLRLYSYPSTGQHTYVAAHVENPGPDCFASVEPILAQPGEPITIKASAYFDGAPIDRGVTFTGSIETPEGLSQPVAFQHTGYIGHDPGYSATTTAPLTKGLYEVKVSCDVGTDAHFLPGEWSLGGVDQRLPATPDTAIVPFVRQAHTAFHVESGVSPAIPADNEDYDGDGILNVDEAPGDTDGDGLDDLYDDDADNDDSADSVDPNPRDPNVPNPTTCGTEPVSIGCCEDLGDCDGASGVALFASSGLAVADRAEVLTALGAGADVFNAGSLETNLGTDTLVGNTYSAGDIVARTDAHIQGVAWTSGAFVPQTAPIVDGGVTTGVALTFPDLRDFSVTFPSPAQGDINLQNGESAEPLEGAWGSIRAAEGSTVILNPGAYYIDFLDIEPGAELLVEDAAGPVYVYVQDTLLFKGELNDLGVGSGRVFIGYFGESDTVLEAPMRATVVAPYAKVVFSTSLTEEYVGSFFAESLELRPDVTVRHEPFQWSWYAAPESSTCGNGVEDGDETDVDCGGSCAARCELGQGCGVDADCAEGACVLGSCTLTPGGCGEAVAVELGAPGESNVVAADGCIMVRDEFPEWWGSRNMQLQSLDGGSYPVPFTWSQSCTGGGGSGAYTGSWQSLTFGPTSAACAVVIDLQGGAGTSVALRYYAG